jgi:hypothetical protein
LHQEFNSGVRWLKIDSLAECTEFLGDYLELDGTCTVGNFFVISVLEKIESTRKGSGRGEIVIETTLYQEAHYKGGIQRNSSTFSSQGKPNHCFHIA